MNLPNQWTEYQSRLEAYFDADGRVDPAERALLTELDQLVLVVVTALAQSVAGGIGLAVAGVPFAAILTAVMFMLAIAQLGPVLTRHVQQMIGSLLHAPSPL